MEEYITLYRAQGQLNDNNAILDLLYIKGENKIKNNNIEQQNKRFV